MKNTEMSNTGTTKDMNKQLLVDNPTVQEAGLGNNPVIEPGGNLKEDNSKNLLPKPIRNQLIPQTKGD